MKIQMKSEKKISPLKIYKKKYEDICRFDSWDKRKNHFEAVDGSVDGLISRIRDFYKETHLRIFDSIVKEIWLEQQIIYRKRRRAYRIGNGIEHDLAFGQFMKMAVGTSQRVLTANFVFSPIATYLIDFFPEFLFYDPFKDPQKYTYPYKNITLDFLVFVHQLDNRLELLDEADRRGMSYAEFMNWATNWVYCYNEEFGDKYQLYGGQGRWVSIKNKSLNRFWEKDKLNFNVR